MKRAIVRRLPLILTFLMVLSIANTAYAPITVPLVNVDPAESTANPGESFTVDVNIGDVLDLFSYEVRMSFDPNILAITGVQEGSFLKQTVSPFGTYFVANTYTDYIYVVGLILGAHPGIDGSGTLFNVTFNVLDAGTSDLDIFDSLLLDSVGPAVISHDVADGFFYTTARADLVRRSAWPEHHHLVVSKDEDAYQTLNAKVKNLGPIDVFVRVEFDIVRDDTFVTSVSTSEVLLTPDTIMELTADFGPLDAGSAGKYYASARASYSWSGTYWSQGVKVKTFSFAIVP